MMVCNDGMAVMTHRTTFTLDGATVRRLKRLASRWKVSQAEVIRRALAQAEVQPDPLPDDPVSMLRRLHESSEAIDPKRERNHIWLKFTPIESAGGAGDLS
jgi:Ribbon-helix-helix protein, copG family